MCHKHILGTKDYLFFITKILQKVTLSTVSSSHIVFFFKRNNSISVNTARSVLCLKLGAFQIQKLVEWFLLIEKGVFAYKILLLYQSHLKEQFNPTGNLIYFGMFTVSYHLTIV